MRMETGLVKLMVLVTFLSICYAQDNKGQCRTNSLAIKESIDIDKALGIWRMVSMWSGTPEHTKFLSRYTCQTFNITRKEDSLALTRAQKYWQLENGKKSIVGKSGEDINVDSNLSSVWHSSVGGVFSSDIVWLDTNYKDWKLVYDCYMLDEDNYLEILGFLVRDPRAELETQTLDFVDHLAIKYGFSQQRTFYQCSLFSQENKISIDKHFCSGAAFY